MQVHRLFAAYISRFSTLNRFRFPSPSLEPALSVLATPILRAQWLSTTARVIDNGRKLSLSCSGDEMRFHTVWLRHNCHCNQCVSSSGQKIMSFESLRGDLKITSADVRDNKLVVNWNNIKDGEHAGFLPIEFLKGNNYAGPNFLKEKHAKMQPLVTDHLPKVDYKEVMESEEGLWRWLRDLNHYGMCLLFGGPTESGNVMKLGRRISHIQKHIYGEMFDLKTVENPIDIAYSSLEIPFHMDLVYYQSPPGLQLLYCIKFDECVEGGENILLDTYPVVEEMRRKHPKQFDTLTRVPATFQKTHYNREDHVEVVFQRPHIVLNRDQKVVSVHWSHVTEGPLQVPEHEVEEYYEAYTLLAQLFNESPLTLTHRLQPGEVLTFNNHRVIHGRLPFVLKEGERHLEGVYINIDEFKSRFMVVSRSLGKHNKPKHVFNGCWCA